MTGFFGDIEKLTEKNKYFRQVLFTGKYAQLVVMNLQPGEEIGNGSTAGQVIFGILEGGVLGVKIVHQIVVAFGVVGLKIFLPILPNPLMPTLIAIRVSPPPLSPKNCS